MYICWLAFEGVYLYFFVTETRGLSLEETAALFDGAEAIDQIHCHALAQVTAAPSSSEVKDGLSADDFYEPVHA